MPEHIKKRIRKKVRSAMNLVGVSYHRQDFCYVAYSIYILLLLGPLRMFRGDYMIVFITTREVSHGYGNEAK